MRVASRCITLTKNRIVAHERHHSCRRVWLIDADKHDHSTIRWSVMRSPFPVDLDIFHTAGEAMSALEVTANPPHVIITDTKLPGTSGLDFLKWLMRSRFSTLPVVIRCASPHEEEIAAAYEAGANAYVIKAHDLHLIDRNISGIAAFFGKLPRLTLVEETEAEPVRTT